MNGEILQIAKEHLHKVKRSGNEEVMAICPFHRKADGSEEHTGSFAMNIHSGLWYCHACHLRGNLYTFLRDVGISRADIDFRYKGALEEAEHYAPARPDPLAVVEATTEALDESFLGMFDFCPVDLLNDGYPEELLRRFDVGFDEKHMRITFPLRDKKGRLIGISGRTIINAQPRYKVYDYEYKDFGLPERKTEKRVLLWNIHKIAIQLAFERDIESQYVVVTEGFKGAMRVAQAGIANTTALMGSYLSSEQQWMLERLGCPVLLMFDNDQAGQSGLLDAAKRLSKTMSRVYIVEYNAPQPSDLQQAAIIDALLGAKQANSWLTQQAIHPY